MKPLVALDYGLSLDLVKAIERCESRGEAFAVLDQRVSPIRREKELEWLGATHVESEAQRVSRETGRAVDGEVALVMLTSGSSGAPKAVEHTWDSLRASARLTSAELARESTPTWFATLPANHIGGLAVIMRHLLGDAELLFGEPDELPDAPGRGATHVAVVRTHLARYDLSRYELVLLGGARPPGVVPPNVVTTWGMTETGSGVVYDRRALPEVDLLVVDGELCVRSPTLARGYRHGALPTLTDAEGNEWFRTGDGAEISHGQLHVLGRVGYVINTGGEKVWPEALEALLAGVDGVLDCAVVGVPDPEWGERIEAVVVARRPLDDALRERAEEYLGPWSKPKGVTYVDAVPRTANGKVDRTRVRALILGSD
ncbi:MAG: AMP-binding protein [Acidimicrobiaceae bacterium]|nr:AMP-binding protein [Acidimicrobiaceae bacterium]